MADIVLSMGLNTDEVDKAADNLQKEVKSIFKNVGDDKNLSKTFKNLMLRMDKTAAKATRLREKIAEMSSTVVETDEFKDLQKDINSATKELERYSRTLESVKAKGKSVDDPAYKSAEENVKRQSNALSELYKRQEELRVSGRNYQLKYDEKDIEPYYAQLNQLNNSLRLATSSAYEMKDGLESLVNIDMSDTQANASGVRKELVRVVNTIKNMSFNAVKKGFNKMLSLSNSLYKSLGRVAKRLGDIAKKSLGNLAKRLFTINELTSKQDNSLKSIITKTLRWGFCIRSVFILWRKLRAYAQDALKLMAQQFEEVDRDVSEIINSFERFKNSMGTIVQPLMHAFLPALMAIADAINSATIALANFFAILTGQKYIYKAKKANDSYAESLKGTGAAAKEAKEELAEYDNLLVIPQDNSGSGGRGSGDDDLIPDAFMKDLAHSRFAEQIKEAIRRDDWEGVGILFAEKLNTIISSLNTWLKTSYAPAAKLFSERLARTLNGFVGETDFEAIGDTIGDAITDTFIALNKFFEEFDFDKLGRKLSQGINGLAKAIDGPTLGKFIANRINAAIDFLYGALDELDIDAIADTIVGAINTFFLNVEPEKFAATITKFLTTLLNLIAKIASQLDWKTIGETLGTVFAEMDWSAITEAFFNAFGEIAGGIGTALAGWIDKDALSGSIAALVVTLGPLVMLLNTLSPLILGIVTPLSTMFKLFKTGAGVVSKCAKVFSVFGANLAEAFSYVIGGAGTLHESLVAVFGGVATTIAGIVSVVSGAILAVVNFFDMLKNGFNWLNEILMVVGIALAAIGAIILGAPALVAGVVAGIVAAVATLVIVIKDNWDKITAFFTAAKEVIIGTLKDTAADIGKFFGDIISGIKEFTDTVGEKITGIFSAISDKYNSFKEGWNKFWEDIGNKISAVFTAMITTVKDSVNTILCAIIGFFNGAIKGLNKMISGINSIKVDVPDWVSDLTGIKTFGFAIPELKEIPIPKLAEGAVIPPNKEFMAILGDQKNGTNIETPLATMVDAFKQALSEFNVTNTSNNQPIVLQLNGRVVAQAVWDEEDKRYKQTRRAY